MLSWSGLRNDVLFLVIGNLGAVVWPLAGSGLRNDVLFLVVGSIRASAWPLSWPGFWHYFIVEIWIGHLRVLSVFSGYRSSLSRSARHSLSTEYSGYPRRARFESDGLPPGAAIHISGAECRA
ncbi:hypothetical protein HNR05_001284 [Leifsonia psychrotolerans]|uniref:Uncharacterized protein n=1 Tax=Glaciibacter psychrotolerans TaxID=670054 RepID=A0A7Z0J632_9MICO|nr:hypothetical protein [Leifsonia psychrotolerans]